jgi:catechol 2,3-dioxygenase-like lactoylglutathione lyase family enzyme
VEYQKAGPSGGLNRGPAGHDRGNNQETKMQIKFHHVNLSTSDVPGLDVFYREVMDMKPEPTLNNIRITQQGYSGKVSFLTDGREGAAEFHLAEKDLKIGFKTGQAVNPLEKGHIAFRTDDIAAFKKRLEEKGIPYSDFGAWAMKGWEQIFFYDPAGNIVEVHQVHE